ncbi:unnamed protein product [Darwinula stevensoni]|uniref:Uncharacterized protein n=1 Tax=Darwinula stevensoni TaxID=69355 RepID=A0A7R9A3P8_9CRUS|nr:unnamed protein product [Darwinula stevensoni]CAG0881770.1 unnamed protein product [Darwinula stevensoni]
MVREDLRMDVKKLPQVFEDGERPSLLGRISFRGRVDVYWDDHTLPLLWALDRALAKLPPLSRVKDYSKHGNEHERILRGGLQKGEADCEYSVRFCHL